MQGKQQGYFDETNQVNLSNSHQQDLVHQVSFQEIKEYISETFAKSRSFPLQLLISVTNSSIEKVKALFFSL